jgi:hypothetical protein
LAPFLRASDSPMAIACLRLFTFGWRPLPDFSVPLLARLTALPTLFFAALPYRLFELVFVFGIGSPDQKVGTHPCPGKLPRCLPARR